MNIKEILAQMCLSEQAEATPFKSAEDGTDYAVWKINDGNTAYVLKKASEQELSVYNTFLASAERAVRRNVTPQLAFEVMLFDIRKALTCPS